MSNPGPNREPSTGDRAVQRSGHRPSVGRAAFRRAFLPRTCQSRCHPLAYATWCASTRCPECFQRSPRDWPSRAAQQTGPDGLPEVDGGESAAVVTAASVVGGDDVGGTVVVARMVVVDFGDVVDVVVVEGVVVVVVEASDDVVVVPAVVIVDGRTIVTANACTAVRPSSSSIRSTPATPEARHGSLSLSEVARRLLSVGCSEVAVGRATDVVGRWRSGDEVTGFSVAGGESAIFTAGLCSRPDVIATGTRTATAAKATATLQRRTRRRPRRAPPTFTAYSKI
jgi:hypothetical protein